jgi:NitT/TauT family transport system substrate-binding protein
MTLLRMRWVVVAVAMALAVSGCGGDDAESGDGPAQIKVQDTAGVPSAFVGFGVEKGIFDRRQLQVEVEPTQGGAATLPALVSGDIQIGGSNVVSLLLAASKGLPVTAIAPGTSAQENGEDFGALIVSGDSGIKQAADLEGKTVAVNTLDNIAEVVVKAALEKEGADPAKVKLTEVPFPEMGAALERGDVDAAFSIEPFVTSATRAGARVVNYSYVVTEPGMQVGAYAVSRQYAEENPEVVERYRAAVAETAEYVNAHQDEFRTYLSEQAEIDPELAKDIVLPRFSGDLNVQSLESTAALMQKYGLVGEPVDAQALVTQ